MSAAPIARLAGNFSAAAKQRQGRYAADAEARGQCLLRLGVDLGQAYLGLEHPGGLYKGGRHLPARAAPWRPEVDQHRDVAAADVTVEARGVEVDRVGREQRLRALAAAWGIDKTGSGYAVDRIAMGADQVQGGGHREAPECFRLC